MQPLDSKKFITGFLLLATAASSLALLFTNQKTPSVTETVREPRPVSQNAFVEPFGEIAPRTGEATPSVATAPTTVTDQLAKILAEQLIAANADRAPGEAAPVVVPNTELTLDELSKNPAAVQLALAKRLDRGRESKPVRTNDSYAAEDIRRYADVFSGAMGRSILSDAVRRSLDDADLNETMLGLNASFDAALRDLEGVAVPAPLINLHRAALATLTSAYNITTANLSASDPLVEALAIETEARNLVAANDRLIAEQQDLIHLAEKLQLSTRNGLGPIGQLLGIRTANAQMPVVDVANVGLLTAINIQEGKSFVQKLLEFARKVLTETLKDRLVHQLVKQTITWIQGGGKPQFVTDWKGFLGRAADEATGNALYRISPKLCQSFGPLIYVSLLPVDQLTDTPVACTLSQVVENVRDFADSFENGGWVAYGAALEPSNNFFGSLIQVRDITLHEQAAAIEAAESDATAAEGWLSTEVCVEFGEFLPSGCDNPATCTAEKRCKRKIKTTPGAALGQTVYNALGAPLQRIVNAQDLAALTSALVNAALTKLIDLGNTGINKGLAGLELPDPSPADLNQAFNECNKISNPTQRQDCINQICRAASSTAPQCFANVPPTPSSTPSSTPSQCGPNPRQGCTCVGDPGGPTAGSFQFTGDVTGAQAAVLADCRAGMSVGLNCTNDPPSVADRSAYTAAVAAKISPAAGIIAKGMADEVGVADEGRARSESFDIVTDPPSGVSSVSSRPVGVCVPADEAIFQ